ncbi:hypothetical protein [uncultured Chitinophaga sp.]|uniref:hypothetical protein n=1 Tax=uncultured Chitinophaga sp. TaxID=339340 RepID=UPI0025E780BA|nr:hypothetical protein [uncultured Chitinophaga sp.]
MKFLNTCFAALTLLSVALAGCQDDDNYLVKEEAFSVVTGGFNGSSDELVVTIDTMTMKFGISPVSNFKRTDKYTFPEGKDSVMVSFKEKETGKLVYERSVKRGDYSITIELIYVGGRLISKPVAPTDNPAGFKLVSYLFLPNVSNYTGDIDIVYYKKVEVVQNNQLVFDRREELARITTKPYTFSEFLKAPEFKSGRNEIDGKVYFFNVQIMFYKAGTNELYHVGTGYTANPSAGFPFPYNTKPMVVGVMEQGLIGGNYIENFYQIQF